MDHRIYEVIGPSRLKRPGENYDGSLSRRKAEGACGIGCGGNSMTGAGSGKLRPESGMKSYRPEGSAEGSCFEAVTCASANTHLIREELQIGVGRSLINPVTAVATHIDACLRLIDEIKFADTADHQVAKLKALLHDTAVEAGQTVELMRHWTSFQRTRPGKKSIGNPAMILQECVNAVRHRLATKNCVIKAKLRCDRSSYFDQYGCFSLVRDILLKPNVSRSTHVCDADVECFEDKKKISIRICVRVRKSKCIVSVDQQVSDLEIKQDAPVLTEIITETDLGRWSEDVCLMGGAECKSSVSDMELDFRFSFIPHILRGTG